MHSRLSPEYVLMGFLYQHPGYGYDLHRRLSEEFGYIWHVSRSQTHNILKRQSPKVEGTSTWHVFQHIMLPLASRALMTAIILSWTRALGEFGAILLFAGNLEGKTQTMPLAIYVGFEQGLGITLVLSVVLLAVSFVLLVVLRRLELKN